jgi:hypothetical protein
MKTAHRRRWKQISLKEVAMRLDYIRKEEEKKKHVAEKKKPFCIGIDRPGCLYAGRRLWRFILPYDHGSGSGGTDRAAHLSG